MDLIGLNLIVTVLSAGSLAFSKQLGGKAVDDAYRKLRGLLLMRVKSEKPIEALEKAPESPIRKKALAKELAKVGINSDLVASARKLERALNDAEAGFQGKSAREHKLRKYKPREHRRSVATRNHSEALDGSAGSHSDHHTKVSVEYHSNKTHRGKLISFVAGRTTGIPDEIRAEHRRTIDANLFADVFEPGRLATLTITLRLPLSESSGKWQGLASLDLARGPVITILKAHGFTQLSETPPPVDLQPDRDSPPLAFEIRIEAAANRWLQLFLLQAGVQVGELLINDFTAFSQSSAAIVATAPFRKRTQADLSLFIRANDKNIEGCSPRERGCFDYKSLGEFRYPEQSFRKLLEGRLRGLYDEQSSAADIEHELQLVGVELAGCLPVDLVQLFRRPDIRSVMLRHEDDFDFPFELCYLDDPRDPFFVGDRIAICRWYLGVTYPPDVLSKTISKVAYLKGTDDASVSAELQLRQVYGDRMETFGRRDEVISRVFKTNEFDLIHFTGHCRERDNANAGLEMEDGTYLRLMEIGQLEAERAFAKAQPFVMLNACASAQPYLGLTHRGSFAYRFISSNACAVVGTLWPVEGNVANEVAAEFYKQASDKPIGPALLAAKSAILNRSDFDAETDDDSRARLLYRQVAVRSYCLFSSPELRLVG